MPSVVPMRPSAHTTQNAADAQSRKGISLVSILRSTTRGRTSALLPRTRPMLATLLPRILPSDTPLDPFKAATTLTRSSGADVANATTVKPTMIGRIDRAKAREAAPRTIHSEPA